MPLWWNWQTRGTQNPVVAIPCRFDPDQRHHNKKRQVKTCLFLLWYQLRGDVRGNSLAVARQFACKFLPRVPVYGIRQSPKGTDRHQTLFGYNGDRYSPEQVKTCLFLLWCRLRGDVRGNSLAVVRQFACKFLPRVPVYGIRQSPKGTDRHQTIFGYNGDRYFPEQVKTCLFCYGSDCEGRTRQLACRRSSICLQILAEGSRLRDTAIPEGYRPASHNIWIQR